MANVFLTVLGTGFYSECDYIYCNQVVRTKYVQEALVKFLAQDWKRENGDKIIILLTDDAKNKNYITKDETDVKLDRILTGFDLEVEEVHIEVGANEDELRQIFNQIVEHTNYGDHVILDITYSLRNIPIQALVALNYAKVIKGIEFDGIYYGAFELGKKQEETICITEVACSCGNGTVQREEYIKQVEIFNLNTYIELLDWTHAINTFLQTGSAKEVKNLYDNANRTLNKKEDRSINYLNNIVNALYNFTSCISNSRGMNPISSIKKLSLRSIGAAANSLDKAIKELDCNQEEKIPLKALFHKVGESIQSFVEKDNLGVGLATVEWCIKYDMIQQGYTALEETLKTYICNIYNIDDSLKKNREEKAGKILACLNIEKEKWIVTAEERLFIEEKVSELDIKYPNLKGIVSEIIQKRNDINHFGFQSSHSFCVDELREGLDRLYKAFIKIATK